MVQVDEQPLGRGDVATPNRARAPSVNAEDAALTLGLSQFPDAEAHPYGSARCVAVGRSLLGTRHVARRARIGQYLPSPKGWLGT
jgi:hypothetical protein